MKIAIVTCNLGDIDDVIKPCKQNGYRFDYFCYTEDNLPFPLPHLNNRLRGRFLKTQTHKFLTHDIFIWIDGRIKITSPDFLSKVIEDLLPADENLSSDMMVAIHPDRNSPYDELEYVRDKVKEGSPYLLERYANDPFDEELKFYKKEKLPHETPLFACGVFARWNEEHINTCFDEWWQRSIQFSNFDQGMFSYVSWKHKLKLSCIPLYNDLYEVGKHKQKN